MFLNTQNHCNSCDSLARTVLAGCIQGSSSYLGHFSTNHQGRRAGPNQNCHVLQRPNSVASKGHANDHIAFLSISLFAKESLSLLSAETHFFRVLNLPLSGGELKALRALDCDPGLPHVCRCGIALPTLCGGGMEGCCSW